MDNLDFLDEPEGSDDTTPAVETTDAAPPAPEPTPDTPPEADGQPRGPDGKFLPKASDAAPAADAAPQAPATPPEASQPPADSAKPPEGFVPIAVVQAMREELNGLKRQQTPPPPPQPAPDRYVDPDAFAAWSEGQQIAERAQWSRQLAEARHGPEAVAAAQQWAAERFNVDPVFRQQSLSTRDPYNFAIEQHRQHQALTMLSDPRLMQQFVAFASGQAAPPQTAASPPAQHIPPQVEAPPASIASAPNAGGGVHQPVGQGNAYDSIF